MVRGGWEIRGGWLVWGMGGQVSESVIKPQLCNR